MKRSALNKKSDAYKEGTRFIVILAVLGILFLSLVGYLTYIELWGKQAFMNNPHNQRQYELEKDVLRGSIYDRFGERLAYSTFDEAQNQVRVYPYEDLYCHVIGYSSRRLEKSQLELKYNQNLLGASAWNRLSLSDEKQGESLYITLSHTLQKKAKALLGNNTGAIVALNPAMGEVLCMYSYPTFNPNEKSLVENWEKLNEDTEKAPLLNRATMGLYPPGSVLKTLWAGAAIENGLENEAFEDEGSVEIGGKTFQNVNGKAYGKIDLKQAFTVSSNVAFIRLSQVLGESCMRTYAKKAMFGEKITFDLPIETPSFGYSGSMRNTDLAASGIGQGKVLTTPLYMAMLCASVANDGIMMQPYLVSSSIMQNGITTVSAKSKILGRVFDAATAETLTAYMESVVEEGTGKNARISGVRVAGKTGTAETGEGKKDHSWFIGFAPAENPQIAVAVVLEHGGAGGGASAAPIAREIIKCWLETER